MTKEEIKKEIERLYEEYKREKENLIRVEDYKKIEDFTKKFGIAWSGIIDRMSAIRKNLNNPQELKECGKVDKGLPFSTVINEIMEESIKGKLDCNDAQCLLRDIRGMCIELK